MGRYASSDAEKLAKGTFDKRYSQEERNRQTVNKVLAFPVLKEIPKPGFPLSEEKGLGTFKYWAEKLLDAGLLTHITVGYIENLALLDDKLHKAAASPKGVSTKDLDQRRHMLAKLEALDVDTTLFAAAKNKSSFAQNGFPSRLRSPAEHQARRTA